MLNEIEFKYIFAHYLLELFQIFINITDIKLTGKIQMLIFDICDLTIILRD